MTAHIHIRRCAGNTDCWAAEIGGGTLIGTSHSLEDLACKVAQSSSKPQEILLHIEPSEATRQIDRYIRDLERELTESAERTRLNRKTLRTYQEERAKIRARTGQEEEAA